MAGAAKIRLKYTHTYKKTSNQTQNQMGAARAGVTKLRLKHTRTKNNIESNPESEERCNGRGSKD
jgi:hypothetical protein